VTGESTKHPVLRPLLLGIYAQLGGLGCAMLITAVYATSLAVRARGTPDQALINAFAVWSSPWTMAAGGIILTFVLGRRLAREMSGRPIAAALWLGAASGGISLLPALVQHGRPSLRSLLIAVCAVLAAWAGAHLFRASTAKTNGSESHVPTA
jgi:hypothetical protein